MTWGVSGFGDTDIKIKSQKERNVEVEHSCIDFTKVIIGEKIRSINENKFRPYSFNDQRLAELMMIEDDEYIEFYNLEVVRKIIDFQFEGTTKKFLSLMFKFYGFGFLIPFMISLSVESITTLNICYTLCFFT